MSERETTAVMTMSGESYFGCTGILRRGAHVQPDVSVTGDPAMAPADAWRMAETRGGIPCVYEVGRDAQGLVVLGDVLITGRLARQAIDLTA